MNGIHGIIYKNGKMHLVNNCLENGMHHISNFDSSALYTDAALYPVDGKWWLSPKEYPDEWELGNYAHRVPGWFQSRKYEKDFRKMAYHWWKKHVLYRKDIACLTGGIYLIKNCHIGEISGSTRFICCDSKVQIMKDTSTAIEMLGRSSVDSMSGNSRIVKLNDYSFVRKMCEYASVKEMNDNSTVESMIDSASVEILRGHSRVYDMESQANIGSARGQAVIYTMRDESTIGRIEYISHILSAPENIKVASSCRMEPLNPFN